MACEYQKDVTFDEVQAGDLILVELFTESGGYLGDRRGTAQRRVGDTWFFEDMPPVYRSALGYRMFKITDLNQEPDLERVLTKAENSESTEAIILAAEVRRLRAIEQRMIRLEESYYANVVMLAGIAQSPDGLLGIMAECSLSAAEMIRKALNDE